MVYRSCLTSCRTTSDIVPQEIRKYQDDLKTSRLKASCSILLSTLKICQYQQKILQKQKLNFCCRVLFYRKTTVCLRYFCQDCLCKQYFASTLPLGSLSFYLFKCFGNSKVFNTFQPKIRATNWQKSTNIFLLQNYFSDLFTEVEILYWKPLKFSL